MNFNSVILQDPDPSVLTFTLQTLNVILESEGGVVINDNMAKYLVRRIEGGGMPGRAQIPEVGFYNIGLPEVA